MKLNYNCIRDVLLYLEDNLKINEPLHSKNIELDYSFETIQYSVFKLEEAGYIQAQIIVADGLDKTAIINDITFYGHEFLNTVRPKTVWENTKDISVKLGVKSISALSQIASQIATQLIKKELGL